MAKKNNSETIIQETIIKKIIFIREEKVILDVHLAELYGVETRALKQAVRRNLESFPGDFMFELDENEINGGITICDTTQKIFRWSKAICIYGNRRSYAVKCIKKPESC